MKPREWIMPVPGQVGEGGIQETQRRISETLDGNVPGLGPAQGLQ